MLPLDAAVEESPFPTLQEIEEISKKKALEAHASRPMPETDNPLWKLDEDEVRVVRYQLIFMNPIIYYYF